MEGLNLKQKVKMYIGYVVMLIGVIAILGVVSFATPNDIASGEMAYQKLWLGRMSLVFAVCALFALILNGKAHLSFPSCVTWVLIFLGGVEAFWGLRQIYGFAVSNHSLYALTGSFFNPGPYSGYLAMIFPLCLHEWLNLRNAARRTYSEQIRYYASIGVMLLILCVLPAGMSRSAWIAVAVSGTWVYGVHASWLSRLKEESRTNGKRLAFVLIVSGLTLVAVGYNLFQIKAASANGRLFMWKISSLAIAEKPLTGYGSGSFAAAYGRMQESYFAKGDYSGTEELVAGSPEYAFNEYLQIAVEYGIPVLVVLLSAIAFCLWKGIREKRIGICGGVISVLVFAFSSYPMQIPGFAVAFFFLLGACVVGCSRQAFLFFLVIISVWGTYYLKTNRYEACKEWNSAKMLYNIGAYQSAKEEYEKLYPDLKNRGAFLFEYGHCLHKLKEYDSSTKILEEAMEHTCDPMVLNIIGKNYQATGDYEKAEENLIRSTHRLPGRIYPYYLLAKLYALPEFYSPEKLYYAVNVVLTKEPKVQSTAVREMREEVRKLNKYIFSEDNGNI